MSSITYQNSAFAGLGTAATFSAPVVGLYSVEGKMNIPTIINGGGASALVVVVNNNGSPIYTGPAGSAGFKTNISCAANDVITVVLSSSAAADLGLNVIKSVISISECE